MAPNTPAKRQDGTTPEAVTDETRRWRGQLHRLLKAAAKSVGLPDQVLVTASEMLNWLEAENPTCTAAVHELAHNRERSERTINNHINVLVRRGIALNTCLGGGRRCAGGSGQSYGIDFTPLLNHASSIEKRELARRAECAAHRQLSRKISSLRVPLAALHAADTLPASEARLYVALPRRIGHLSLDDKLGLHDQVLELSTACPDQRDCGRKSLADLSEKRVRPNIHVKENINESRSVDNIDDCRLERVSIEMLQEIMPIDWRVSYDDRGRRGWPGLYDVARQRGREAGIMEPAWAAAEAAVGWQGAIIIALIACARSVTHGGDIRNPGAWMHGIAKRAGMGNADLYGLILGQLHRRRSAS